VSNEDIGILVSIIEGFINEAVEHDEWKQIKNAVEADVERLNHKVTALNKGIERMTMNCGLPDAGDACRAVIATGKALLDERVKS